MLVRVRGLQESFGLEDAMEMHDPVAVWYTIAHAGLRTGETAKGWEVKGRDFKVERIGELTRGMCVVDRRGTGDEGESRVDQERLKESDLSKGRKSGTAEVEKRLPGIAVGTPGKEVLRTLLLSRVFGDA
jgi:inosine-uridine nucleoside N-ribohydrolase